MASRDAGADAALKILRGDAPLEAMADDEFGLKKVVDGLSTTLAKRIGAAGYALGVEGRGGAVNQRWRTSSPKSSNKLKVIISLDSNLG